MRERDEAAFQPGSALFLRRMRGAHGRPELFQIGRRAAFLRDPGCLRVEQNAHVRSERAGAERATERRRFDSGGVGARYCDSANPGAEARSRRARHVRRQNEEGDALQTPRPSGTAMRPASRDGVPARNKEGRRGRAIKTYTYNGVLDLYGCVP
jgi:hypothetical protein